MAKARSQYVCQECGAVSSRWSGKCEQCDSWNSLVEETVATGTPGGLGKKGGRAPGIGGGATLNLVELTGNATY